MNFLKPVLKRTLRIVRFITVSVLAIESVRFTLRLSFSKQRIPITPTTTLRDVQINNAIIVRRETCIAIHRIGLWFNFFATPVCSLFAPIVEVSTLCFKAIVGIFKKVAFCNNTW